MLENISRGLCKGRSAFVTITPSPINLLKFKWIKFLKPIPPIISGIIQKKSLETILGESIAHVVSDRLFLHKAKSIVTRGFTIGQERPNWKLEGLGATRRTWVTVNDRDFSDERIVKKLVIVYHHANKAGKHIDVHLGHLSLVYRVTGKPFEKDLKFNNQGRLTEASKQLLLNHVRSEIAKNARVPWNHDHTISNAKADWSFDESLSQTEGYGSGPTRQIIAEDTVEFYHPEVKSSLHMYAPLLNPDQGLYIYKIYEGNGKSAPILIFGNLIPRDEKFQDRLHLTMIQEKDFKSDFLRRVDHATITRKFDGASAYFSGTGEIEKGHSFKVFSPRMSKVTGHRIEYTYKAPELATNGAQFKAVGMGEMLFWKSTAVGRVLSLFGWRGPEHLAWNYLSAAGIGGILNSNQTRPRDVYPELRVYRIDRFEGKDTGGLPFFANRAIQTNLVQNLDQRFWKVVNIVRPRKNTNWEGLVGVPEGLSINDGLKCKWWADANDWEVIRQELEITPKGNIGGVVWFRSLESGKEFKLGPGGLGDVDRQTQFLHDNLIGQVFKVHGRNGHEGRAAKIVDDHLDKGVV
jgi:hypothetical protein